MTRVKGGAVSKNRRRKVLKRAKGYFGSKHRLYKTAQEQLFHSGAYSFNDRKKRANDFRKLWITRINASCRNNDITYSKFINGLKKANVSINRKMLSELAIFAPDEFVKLIKLSKDALEGKTPKEEKEAKKVTEKVEKTVKENTTQILSSRKFCIGFSYLLCCSFFITGSFYRKLCYSVG